MSKESREFFEQIKAGEKPTGVIEAIREGVQAVAPGLSLSNIFSDIKWELKDQLAHGAHELASALFRGDPFVMYPRTNQADKPGHDQSRDTQQQEHDRGGREM
jgi:hypothetical protein